jgi:hypothetical protein
MLVAALGLLVSAHPAAAQQSLRDSLYDLGRDTCSSAIDGEVDGVDGLGFVAVVDSVNWERAEYCHCVAGEFQDLDADDLASMTSGTKEGDEHLAFITTMNMAICLPGSSDDADIESDGEVEDGDLAEWETEELPDEDFAYDEGDKHMCEMALDDAIMVPGFDLEDILVVMKKTGQSRDDLCTCAARYFAAGGEPLQQEIENASNPNIVYASTLAGAIETCRL